MKINLSSQDLNKLLNLLKVNDISMNISSMYLYYLLNAYNSISASKVEKISKKGNMSIEKAFYYTKLQYNGTSEEEYLQLPASITFIGDNALTREYASWDIFIRFKGTREQLDLLGTNWYTVERTTIKALGE